jgi:hypothetical protein
MDGFVVKLTLWSHMPLGLVVQNPEHVRGLICDRVACPGCASG